MAKARGPLYSVHFRRRREARTDYAKRLALLKSGKPRMIVRKTNRFVVVEFAEFAAAGDRVIVSTTSKTLTDYGFAGKRNTLSAYLTGLLAGRLALAKGVKEFVADIGLHKASNGSIVFAAVKGAVDAGLHTNYAPEKLPSGQRMKGEHLKEDARKGFEEAKNKIMLK